MKKKKTPTRRNKVKYPALKKKFNSRVRQEWIDFEYLHLLSPDELEWLNKFMAETNGASFENDRTDFYRKKKDKRQIYQENNARNRDLYGLTKGRVANTHILNIDQHKQAIEDKLNQNVRKDTIEDAIIEMIDLEKKDDSAD